MGTGLNMLAFDLGSSNGRGILGLYDGERIEISEVYRFENGPVLMNGMLYWDIPYVYMNMLRGFSEYKKTYGNNLASFGIDAWGNDFGLLDKNGHLLTNARSARHTTRDDVQAVHKIIPGLEIFKRTGLSSYSINSLYQLYRRVREEDPGIAAAAHMLMVPDLLAYFCTGIIQSEYSISTTTMMYNPSLADWDRGLLESLSISDRILPSIVKAGQLTGSLKADIAADLGLDQIPYAVVGAHDTASAVAALPVENGENDFAFCSSGTWCMVGTESPDPIMDERMFLNGLSNEGTVQGTFRPLYNITGMWILQECIKRWKKEGISLTWDDITAAMLKERPFRLLINPDDRSFFDARNMPAAIAEYCRKTSQHIPENVGQIARCIYESLILKYRWVIEQLELFQGKRLNKLYIVGGTVRNKVMNQMAADCLQRIVITGSEESACVGNLLMQLVALGEVNDISQARQVARNSFDIQVYQPAGQTGNWDEAYSKFCELLKREEMPLEK